MSGLLDVIAREAILFAGLGLLIGGVDDLCIDLLFLLRRIVRRRAPRLHVAALADPHEDSVIVVFVAAWDEGAVIGGMLSAAVARYDHPAYRIYVGIYPNDRPTIDAVAAVAARDARVVPIVGGRDGPTTKADCLNTLWRGLRRDEEAGLAVRAIVFHDAEDVVHPAELRVFDVTGQTSGKKRERRDRAGHCGIHRAVRRRKRRSGQPSPIRSCPRR